MNKKARSARLCLHLTLAEILAETVSAMLTSLARVKLAQCKQNLARPWLGHGQGASVNRVIVAVALKLIMCIFGIIGISVDCEPEGSNTSSLIIPKWYQ